LRYGTFGPVAVPRDRPAR